MYVKPGEEIVEAFDPDLRDRQVWVLSAQQTHSGVCLLLHTLMRSRVRLLPAGQSVAVKRHGNSGRSWFATPTLEAGRATVGWNQITSSS